MGEYHSGGGLGRYISIYYGSFERVYGHLSREGLKRQLAHTLKHEFTHTSENQQLPVGRERGFRLVQDVQSLPPEAARHQCQKRFAV
jgi:hypothetical protein